MMSVGRGDVNTCSYEWKQVDISKESYKKVGKCWMWLLSIYTQSINLWPRVTDIEQVYTPLKAVSLQTPLGLTEKIRKSSQKSSLRWNRGVGELQLCRECNKLYPYCFHLPPLEKKALSVSLRTQSFAALRHWWKLLMSGEWERWKNKQNNQKNRS